MLKINSARSGIKDGQFIVAVESESVGELIGHEAKRVALDFAKESGVLGLGLDNSSGAYPIDSEGQGPEAYNDDLHLMTTEGHIAGYRNEFFLKSVSIH